MNLLDFIIANIAQLLSEINNVAILSTKLGADHSADKPHLISVIVLVAVCKYQSFEIVLTIFI
jgi:hypothetical protein